MDKLKLFDNTFPQNEDVLINNKFTFIQIPKTSSTTIYKAYLTKYTIKTIGCNRHEGLLYLENFIINDKLPVYAVVRNPFYHIHSYFFHRLKHKEISLWNCKNIIQNFEMFVREEVNNIHLQQCRYIKSNKTKHCMIWS